MTDTWMLLGEGSGNNYAYLVTDDKTKDAVIIDPANPSEYATILLFCVGQMYLMYSVESCQL